MRVDGVNVGVAPIPKPIDAEPGPHHVAVTMNGHHPWSRTVQLESGRTTKVVVDLDETLQRKLAWAAMGVGGAGVATGIALGVVSVVEHRKSRDIIQNDGSDLTDEQTQRELEETIARRDDYRLGSGVAAGVGIGLFVTGLVMFAFDEPVIPVAPGKDAVSLVPIVAPHQAGAVATLRFEGP